MTLITGLPGHGKTLYTLARYKPLAEREGRPVFQAAGRAGEAPGGIAGLQLPWPQIDPEKWYEAPANAIVIIDEAQFVFPVRGRGAPPEFVARLATHRHLGIDLVLITQGPMLLDSFVRDLIDRHFDVVRKFGTHFVTVHEYANGVRANVRKSRGTDSIRHQWRYPKEVFGWYKSAERHTVQRRIPARVWVLMSLPVVLAALVWLAYSRLRPQAAAERFGAQSAGAKDVAGVRPGQAQHQAQQQQQQQRDLVADQTPRVPGLAYTAPAFDEVTRPVQAPYPAACVRSSTRCSCYTQQATLLDMPAELCQAIVAKGFFVAWQQSAGDRNARRDVDLAAAQPVVLSGAVGFGQAVVPAQQQPARSVVGPGAGQDQQQVRPPTNPALRAPG